MPSRVQGDKEDDARTELYVDEEDENDEGDDEEDLGVNGVVLFCDGETPTGEAKPTLSSVEDPESQ